MPMSVPSADRAAMQDGVVADGAVLADPQRKAHVGVQRAEFLNVRARADDDRFVVAAQNRAEPDGGVGAEPDVAYEARVGRNPVAVGSAAEPGCVPASE